MSNDSSDESEDYNQSQDLLLQCVTIAACAAGAAAICYAQPLYDKTPYHTSALTGADWVRELLSGHPERIRNELGVHKEVFNNLISILQEAGLRSSKHVFLEEQLAIFLYVCVTGLSLRHSSERFQRSNETTSKYILRLFFTLLGLNLMT